MAIQLNRRFDLLGKAEMLSILNVSSSYWQIKMDDKNVDRTAFVAHHGRFKYTKAPSELERASATFYRANNAKLASIEQQHANVFIGDITISSK